MSMPLLRQCGPFLSGLTVAGRGHQNLAKSSGWDETCRNRRSGRSRATKGLSADQAKSEIATTSSRYVPRTRGRRQLRCYRNRRAKTIRTTHRRVEIGRGTGNSSTNRNQPKNTTRQDIRRQDFSLIQCAGFPCRYHGHAEPWSM